MPLILTNALFLRCILLFIDVGAFFKNHSNIILVNVAVQVRKYLEHDDLNASIAVHMRSI